MRDMNDYESHRVLEYVRKNNGSVIIWGAVFSIRGMSDKQALRLINATTLGHMILTHILIMDLIDAIKDSIKSFFHGI